MSRAAAWRATLGAPVEAAPLVAFRVAFGAIAAVEAARYLAYDWVRSIFLAPTFRFAFHLGELALRIPLWPQGGLYLHFAALLLAGVLVMLGIATRLAALASFVGWTYVFLLDASYSIDLNHLYLFCLYAGLVATLPIPRGQATTPLWTLVMLRAPITLVFAFAGLAKIDADWLRTPIAERILTAHPDLGLGALLRVPHASVAMAVVGLLVDLSLPLFLLARRSRKLAIAVAGLFLALNGWAFPIGIFPWLAFAAVATYWPPAELARWGRTVMRQRAAPPTDPAAAAVTAPISRPLFALVVGAIALQIAVPARSWLYPQPTGWGEEGHFFAWKMMRLDKHGDARFIVRHPVTGAEADWDPSRDLTPLQRDSLATRPLLAQEYARHIADAVEAHEGFRPQVLVTQTSTYGDRPVQPMVDATRDLAQEPFTLGPAAWIVPLQDPPPAGDAIKASALAPASSPTRPPASSP